jgi:alanine-glyoxylate transaminase/(R)-3-amino-2-methylpropionate-pyruvate transaminase
MWGFQAHGVTPDIVCMAKGIGNGYPLAAVVARREIAEAMAKKKFFNTYGSNPVSCSAGRAVLRAIEDDDLIENANVTGKLLLQNLQKLKDTYNVVGDVRGKGLMVGVEIVKDRTTKEPAAVEAAKIAELAKDNGIIFGVGGVFGNILRINPPICAVEDDMKFIADVLNDSCSRL